MWGMGDMGKVQLMVCLAHPGSHPNQEGIQ